MRHYRKNSAGYFKILLRRRSIVFFIGLLAIYFLFRTVTRRTIFKVSLPHVTPNKVWDFMADFSNQQILNPGIFKFQVEKDSSGHNEWNYAVRYWEYYENIPVFTNSALGHFRVYQDNNEGLMIASDHVTCLLSFNIWCLQTTSKQSFRFEGTGSLVTEVTDWQCPYILVSVCRGEVETQRSKVFSNLESVRLKKSLLSFLDRTAGH
ncbi:uncharacterized protein LOC111711700 isoform X2 [Eurytemora carolleeae]|uniref:uncharacterized protein LOC111711700 isoform X2 n=1 Tax=Eurytemora carolleeae TaxID=1294199 RepID=UPI000C781295|nr:uncharacterized protein LOC111711700 isoform X2 [Eurytemora carolleeae]|eukprot:XP_023341874.1 uncharacterized protein LOC111711700 isoform X2 [Eurytemora affinis]